MLTEVTCVVVVCDSCNGTAFDSGGGGDYDMTLHFDTIEDAYESVRESEWIVVGERVTCNRCAEKAACDLTGHDFQGSWQPIGPIELANGTTYTGRGRHCYTCGRPEYDPPIPPGEDKRASTNA